MAIKIGSIDYAPTEADIKRMLTSGNWQALLSRDYAGVKQSVGSTINQTNNNSVSIEQLDGRLTTAEGQIVQIIGRVDELEAGLDTHVADRSAHGATGNIVGTLDFCTTAIGGVVLLGGAVPNAYNPGASVPSGVGPAPATYDQAYTDEQSANINGLINSVAEVATMATNAINTLNALLAALRAAKQIAP